MACWDRCGQPAPLAKPAWLTGLGTAGQLPSAARPLHGVPGLLSLHWPECQTTGDGSSDISAQMDQSFLAFAIASKDPWHAPMSWESGCSQATSPLRVAPEHWAHLLRQVVRWGEMKLSKSPSQPQDTIFCPLGNKLKVCVQISLRSEWWVARMVLVHRVTFLSLTGVSRTSHSKDLSSSTPEEMHVSHVHMYTCTSTHSTEFK